MIQLEHLTRRYGQATAVDDLTLTVPPGRVTGFLGPNGAGKSTTMRMLLGLERPSSGRALVNGRHYATLSHPLHEVGALLDAGAVHPGRSARAHLRALACSHGIPRSRVDAVLGATGLEAVADRRAGTFSLGMRQRLGVAGALLGDPEVLVLDEPVNGLDPDGVLWVRELMRSLAAEGRTVFVSSHLMSEMELTADHLVVIGRGRLLADRPMAGILDAGRPSTVSVRGPELRELAQELARSGAEVVWERPGAPADGRRVPADGRCSPVTGPGTGAQPDVQLVSAADAGHAGTVAEAGQQLTTTGVTVEDVGRTAHRLNVLLYGLTVRQGTLEQAYLALTAGAVQYGAQR